MSFTYTNAIPVGTNNPSQDWTNMNTNTTSISGLIAVDHIGFNTANGGYHNVVHFSNQSVDPGTIAGVGQEYTKTVGSDQQLFYRSGGGVITQLTGPNAAVASGNGYTWLPGGILMQWGTKTPVGNGNQTVTFTDANINFPNNCFVVSISIARTGSPNGIDQLYVQSKSTTVFNYHTTTSGTGFASFDWIAIGN